MWTNCFLSLAAATAVLDEFQKKHVKDGIPQFTVGVPMPPFSGDAELTEAWGCPGVASEIPGYVSGVNRMTDLVPRFMSYFRVPHGPPIPWFLAVVHGLPLGHAALGYCSRAGDTCGILRCANGAIHREEDEGDPLLVERFMLNYFMKIPA